MSVSPLPAVPEALLLDLDGTLYLGDEPLPGAVRAVATLAERGVSRRYLTNTTRLSRRGLAERLRGMGFAVEEGEIFTAGVAAAGWLREHGIRRVALHLPSPALEDFASFEAVDTDPEAVVVGDLGDEWSFDRLNTAFRQLLAGARLLALQKNRYWRRPDGLVLDAGPFVAALEHASGTAATVVGKPSPEFFRIAALSLGVPPQSVTVVGDDVEVDVGGAQSAGMAGVLVRTGKFSEDALARSGVRPDRVADSLSALVAAWYP